MYDVPLMSLRSVVTLKHQSAICLRSQRVGLGCLKQRGRYMQMYVNLTWDQCLRLLGDRFISYITNNKIKNNYET